MIANRQGSQGELQHESAQVAPHCSLLRPVSFCRGESHLPSDFSFLEKHGLHKSILKVGPAG